MVAPNPADPELDHCCRHCRRQSRSPAIRMTGRHAVWPTVVLSNSTLVVLRSGWSPLTWDVTIVWVYLCHVSPHVTHRYDAVRRAQGRVWRQGRAESLGSRYDPLRRASAPQTSRVTRNPWLSGNALLLPRTARAPKPQPASRARAPPSPFYRYEGTQASACWESRQGR